MKNVAVIGIGMGESTITPEAREFIARSEVLFGAPRMFELCNGFKGRTHLCYLAVDVAAAIAEEEAQEFAVLVSGDVGFYSAATNMAQALSAYNVRFVPGISTVNAFFAKLKMPWQEAAFMSAHGREMNVVDTVRRNRLTFCLTGNNVSKLGADLTRSGFGSVKTYVGENLGTEKELISEMTAENLTRNEFLPLTVLLFQNLKYDDATPTGLPDSRFIRLDGIPMTKCETRAIVMSKLDLRPNCVCWDVGAGTGSVTVEMALSAYRGHVYAIECKEEAISLINKNCESFYIGNVTVICGKAPIALEKLPAPDAVFIGGSGGEIDCIIKTIFDKNPNSSIVITAVTLETISMVLSALKEAGIEPEITQINVARGKRMGGSRLMEAQNPITIMSTGVKS